MKYELFKLQMQMLKSYEDSAEDLQKEIDDIIYQYAGVRAIRYDKQSFSYNEYLAQETRYKLAEALKEPETQLDYTIYAIQQLKPIVDGNIAKLSKEMQEIVKKLFWENKTFVEVGQTIGYSHNGLWHKVRREVEKI